MNTHRGQSIFFTLLLAIAVLSSASSGPLSVRAAAPTGFASALFQQLWERTDGPVASGAVQRSWLWGPEPGQVLTEQTASNDSVQVQYFDKARMELNPAVTDPESPWRVTTGLLVAELAGLVGPSKGTPADLVVAGDTVAANPRYSDFFPKLLTRAQDSTGRTTQLKMPERGKPLVSIPTTVTNTTYISETGHNIPSVFWEYLNSRGTVLDAGGNSEETALFDWLYVLGYPISEPYWATLSIGGKQELALLQLFQRRVLTYVPSFVEGWQVQMGNTGATYFDWRYNSDAPAKNSESQMPPLISPGGGFVELSGDGFVQRGEPVVLKGTNYWLSAAPFADTWAEWNGPQVQAELATARDLGVNTIENRTPLRPGQHIRCSLGRRPDDDDHQPVDKEPDDSASADCIKLRHEGDLLVLFDWYDDHPPANTPQERSNLAYIDGIVGEFAEDDRVLAWDLSNEPDMSGEWSEGRQSEYIDWLRRMAIHVRSVDPRHPLTVGVGIYSSLWHKSDKGDTILDISDFVSFHCYSAGELSAQIAEIKARTQKPIVLGEMGWPTSTGGEPPRPGATFDEPTQTFLYDVMLNDVKAANFAGVVQWTLYDFDDAKAHLVGGFERYFGLFRRDHTAKPAAQIFRNNYTATLLTSDTSTDIPLDTSDEPHTR